MKHLYKTKDGEILEAILIDYLANDILLENMFIKIRYNLSEVQEVVLDKDGEPFMFEGEVVCVGDTIDSLKTDQTGIIKGFLPTADGVFFLLEDDDWIKSHNLDYLTPKHPQKKGIEKIDDKMCNKEIQQQIIAEKLNQVIEVVNKINKR